MTGRVSTAGQPRPAGEMRGDDRPSPRSDLAVTEIDAELVVLDVRYGRTHLLNASATIIWRHLDVSTTLDELSTRLDDDFGFEPGTLKDQVLALAVQLGRAGLLEGIAQEPPGLWTPPDGLAIGEQFPVYALPDLGGRIQSVPGHGGRGALLIYWSPRCAFCDRLAPRLAAYRQALEALGVDLWLVAIGDRDANARKLHDLGVDLPLVLQGNDVIDQFDGLGTPSAYLVDGEARVTERLTVGSDRVGALVRRLVQDPA